MVSAFKMTMAGLDLLGTAPCAIYDIMRSKEGRESAVKDNALHEAGHALIHLLAGHPIERLRVSSILGTSRNALFSCLRGLGIHTDRISFLAQGETSSGSKIEEELRTGNDPELSVLVYLGGLAATTDCKSFRKFEKDVKQWNSSEWEDITIPRQLIEKAIKRRGFEGTNENICKVLSSIFTSLGEKFKKPEIKKTVESIQILLLKKNDLIGKRGHDEIMQSLREAGCNIDSFPRTLAELRETVNIDRHVSECLGGRN